MAEWRKMELDNGMRVVMVNMPHLHSTEVAVYIKVGGRNDPAAKEGLSHFFEHMLFRGCRELPTGLAIETAFEAIGGAVNAATDAETTCVYSRVHPDHVAEGIRLVAAMLREPLLSDLETEQRIVAEEALDDLNEKGVEVNVDTVAARLLWPDHPLGMPTIGTLTSIASFTRDDLLRHAATYYRPNNAVLVAAGKINPDEIVQAAAVAFGGWLPRPLPPSSLFTGGQDTPKLQFVPDEDSQVTFQLAFRGLSLHDPRLTTLRLLRRLLCGGGSSRLHLKLREELGVVYSVDAAISAYEESGCFTIDFSTAPDNLTVAVAATFAELRRILAEPVANDELERVRRSYLYELEYGRDSCYDMQVRYGWGELVGLVWHPEEEERQVMACGSVAIAVLARELFAPNNLNLVAIGPVTTSLKKELECLVKEFTEWSCGLSDWTA